MSLIARGISINNSGQVAFAAQTPAGRHAFVWNGATLTELDLSMVGGNGLHLTDAGRLYLIRGPFPPSLEPIVIGPSPWLPVETVLPGVADSHAFLQFVDWTMAGTRTTIATVIERVDSNLNYSKETRFATLGSDFDVNEKGEVVYVADPMPGFTDLWQLVTPDLQTGNCWTNATVRNPVPKIASDGSVICKESKWLFLRKYDLTLKATIAGPANGFSSIGRMPSISEDGRLVAFYAVLSADGATAFGTESGPGIFVAHWDGAAWPIFRAAPDTGATFDGFDVNQCVAINGLKNDSSTAVLVFGATKKGGVRTIYSGRMDVNANRFAPLQSVVAVGETVGDVGRVSDYYLYDPLNGAGQAALWLKGDGGEAVALADIYPVTRADLDVEVGSDVVSAKQGDPVHFTVKVLNEGPDETTGIEIELNLPKTTASPSVSISKGSWNRDTRRWSLPFLAKGQSVELQVVTVMDQTVPISLAASRIASTGQDTNPKNDVGSAKVLPQFMVRGNVRRYDDPKVGVGKVKVQLIAADGTTFTVDSEAGPSKPLGSFEIKSVPQGSYALTCKKGGYDFSAAPTSYEVIATTSTMPDILAKAIVEVAAIEIVQVIQDLNNSVPLIAHKPTLVRAYLQLPTGVGDDFTILNSRFNLRGALGDISLVQDNSCLIQHDVLPHRDAITKSVNFRIVDFSQLQRLGEEMKCDYTWSDGVLTALPAVENPLTRTFKTMPNFPVQLFRIALDRQASLPGSKYCAAPSVRDLASYYRQLRAIYPVATVDPYTIRYEIPVVWNALHNDKWLGFPAINRDVLAEWNKLGLTAKSNGSERSDWRPFGVIGMTLKSAEARLSRWYVYLDKQNVQQTAEAQLPAGLTDPCPDWKVIRKPGTTTVSSGFLLDVSVGESRNFFPHELAHQYSLHHPTRSGQTQGGCGARIKDPLSDASYEPYMFNRPNDNEEVTGISPGLVVEARETILGWDEQSDEIVDPRHHYELMGYCQDLNLPLPQQRNWISPESYQRLMRAIAEDYGPKPALSSRGAIARRDMLIVSGRLDPESSRVNIDSIDFVPQTGHPVIEGISGRYVLRTKDAFGRIIREVLFDCVVEEPFEGQSTAAEATFVVLVPWSNDVVSIEIARGTAVLDEIRATKHAPEVRWITPLSGGALGDGTARFEWASSDADGDALEHVVEYSSDGGDSWIPLARRLTSRFLDVDVRQLAGSTNGFFRVTAGDGLLHAVAVTGPVVVPVSPPEIVFRRIPGDRDISGFGRVFLSADASDVKDGVLRDLVWESDRAGVLGHGEVISLRPEDLPEGTHHIKVSARNSAGLESSASFEFRSWVEAIPLLSAASTGDGVTVSWESMKATFVLQSAAAVEGPWADVASAPAVQGHRSEVAVPPVETERFFRLRR